MHLLICLHIFSRSLPDLFTPAESFLLLWFHNNLPYCWPSGCSYQKYISDDLMVSQDFSLKHLMFLQEFHLGLQVAEVSFTVLCHLLHPLRHPLLCLTHRNRSRWTVKQCDKQRIELEIRPI